MANDEYYPEPASDTASESPKEKTEYSDHDTFLVPKSAFGEHEVNPGDKCDIEVVHIYEDEVECKCCDHKESESKSAMDESIGEMESMAGKEE